MSLLKDKLLISIILFGVLIAYIMVSRGEWRTRIEQKNSIHKKNTPLRLTENLLVKAEHFISVDSQIIGSNSYFITSKCFSIDSLAITIFEQYDDGWIRLEKTKTRITDLNELEFDSNYQVTKESLLENAQIEICPHQRIEISNWFKYLSKDVKNFRIQYFIKTSGDELVSGADELIKRREFKILGRHHYDFIILLYPVLWLIVGILLIAKIIMVVKRKLAPNSTS